MSPSISATVKRLYGNELGLMAERGKEAVRKNYLVFAIITALIVGIILMLAIYYNLFNRSEWNIQNSYAQIEKELQRRSDLIENLFPAVLYYAELEVEVFKHISDVRVDSLRGDMPEVDRMIEQYSGESLPGENIQSQLNSLSKNPAFKDAMSKLMAIAEQYPNLRSSEPYRLLMEALTGMENRIADERAKYNDMVNLYNRLITSFPGFVFAGPMGFKEMPMFRAEEGARPLPELRNYKKNDK